MTLLHSTMQRVAYSLMQAETAALPYSFIPHPSPQRRFPLQVFNLSLLTSDLYAFAARGIFFDGFTRHSLTLYLISCTAVVCGLAAYFTALDSPRNIPPRASAGAPHYAIADLHDAYSSPDRRQAVTPTRALRGLVPAQSRDGASVCGRGRSSEAGAGDRAANDHDGGVRYGGMASETGSSPRGRAMVCSPAVGSAAQVEAWERSRSGGVAGGLEMAAADGQVAWEAGELECRPDGGGEAVGSRRSSKDTGAGTLAEC